MDTPALLATGGGTMSCWSRGWGGSCSSRLSRSAASADASTAGGRE